MIDITSSRPRGSSCATVATIVRADAGADRAGQLQFGKAHQVAVAFELLHAPHAALVGVGREELDRTRRSEETAHQRLQRRGGGRAAPGGPRLARLREHVDEERACACSAALWRRRTEPIT